jgi:hypothetical protein
MDGKVKKNWWEQFLPQGGIGSTPRQVATTGSATGVYNYNPNTMVQGGSGATSGLPLVETPETPKFNFGDASAASMQNQTQSWLNTYNNMQAGPIGGKVNVPPLSGTLGGPSGVGEDSEGTDWTGLFESYKQAGLDAAAAARAAREKAAEKTFEARTRYAQEQQRLNRLASQQARAQVSENTFMQENALRQSAASRGLGGSGLEQLGLVQQRMATGKQLNQLVQQELSANTELRNYLSEKVADRETALSEAEAAYEVQKYKIVGENLENIKYLDSIEYRDRVLASQEQTADEAAERFNVDSEEQLILSLANPGLDDYTKIALAKLATQAKTITPEREEELLSGYLGSAAGDIIYQDQFDWTLPLTLAAAFGTTSGLAAGQAGAVAGSVVPGAGTGIGGIAGIVGGTIAGTAAGFGLGVLAELGVDWASKLISDQATYIFTVDGTKWQGTAAEAVNKTSPDSLVYAYRNRMGYQDIQPVMKNNKIVFRINGKDFENYNKAENEWRLSGMGVK